MNKLTPTQASYVAGLVDGDGCISITHQRARGPDTYSITFRIENTSEELLQWLYAVTGAGVLGNSSHEGAKWDRPNIKPMYKWNVYPKELREFLPQIEPYLVLKRERAQITVEWLKRSLVYRGRRTTDDHRRWKTKNCARMQELNKRGVST
jgi:hypothetical protein